MTRSMCFVIFWSANNQQISKKNYYGHGTLHTAIIVQALKFDSSEHGSIFAELCIPALICVVIIAAKCHE